MDLPSPLRAVQVVLALLLYAGYAWLLGAWCARRWLRAAGLPWAAYAPRLRRADMAAAAIAALAGLAGLWVATAVMAGLPLGAASTMLWPMIATTEYGHSGGAAFLALLALLALRLGTARGPLVEGAVLLCLAVLIVARAAMGHAGAQGLWSVALLAQSLHLFAIGLWTGAVSVSACFALRADVAGALPADVAGRYLRAMSAAALLAVIVIAASGAYSGWERVGTGENLLHTAYGQILLAKVGMVAAALALGGYNKFYGLPAAARSAPGVRTVRRVLQAETLLLLAVLATAAALAAQQPPTAT